MRLILTVFTITILLSACDQKQTNPESNAEEANAEIAMSMFAAFNRHDWKAMAEHYTDTASFLDPSLGIDYVKQNHDMIIAKYSEMQSVFPDIHDEVIGIYPFGDKVIIEFISTGKSSDSTSFRLPISTVLTIKDGKIMKDATYYDQ